MGPSIGRAWAREGVNLALVARSEGPLQQVAADLAQVGVCTLLARLGVRDVWHHIAEQSKSR